MRGAQRKRVKEVLAGRVVSVQGPDTDDSLPHLGVVGDTYTTLISGTRHRRANAPHVFTNATDQPARLLCVCSPAGQEELFALVGVPVVHRTQAPPALEAAGQAAFIAKAEEYTPRYRTELLPPPDGITNSRSRTLRRGSAAS